MYSNKFLNLGNSRGNDGLAFAIGAIVFTLAILCLISTPFDMSLLNAQSDIPITDFDSVNKSITVSKDQQDPPLGSDFVWRGIISSDASILPGRNNTQSAVILPPREDGAMYAGILTFQASRPVDAVSWNILDPTNVTLSEDIGDRDDVIPVQGLDIALNELDTFSEAGSVMFTGNVLEFAGDDDPFIVTYNVKARAGNASPLNDVRSLFELAGSEDEQED